MALAANNSDKYKLGEVTEEEGKAFAKKINAIFESISTKEKDGSIDKLFRKIGIRFLHPNYNDNDDNPKKTEQPNKSLKLNKKKGKNGKKGFC